MWRSNLTPIRYLMSSKLDTPQVEPPSGHPGTGRGLLAVADALERLVASQEPVDDGRVQTLARGPADGRAVEDADGRDRRERNRRATQEGQRETAQRKAECPLLRARTSRRERTLKAGLWATGHMGRAFAAGLAGGLVGIPAARLDQLSCTFSRYFEWPATLAETSWSWMRANLVRKPANPTAVCPPWAVL